MVNIAPKLLDHAKLSVSDTFKTASKTAVQKKKNKARKKGKEKKSRNNWWFDSKRNCQQNNSETVTDENYIELPKERYASPEIIDELRLKPYNNGISKNDEFDS